MSALDSLVGEIHLLAGARQSSTPATGAFTAPRRAARGRVEDTLYVLLDLEGGSASGPLAELMQRLTDTYWATPGSVTAALRAGLAAAGEWLMDRNTVSPVAERQQGSAACVVLRGSQVYVAVAGTAGVFVGQHGRLLQTPPPDSDPSAPLGASRAVAVRFGHAELSPGDTILLVDSDAAVRWSMEALTSAVVGVEVEQALKNLERLAGTGDLIALAIQAAMPVAAADEPAARPAEVAPVMPQPRSVPAAPTAPTPATAARAAERTDEPAGERPGAAAKAWLGALTAGLRRGAQSVGMAGQAVVQRTLPEHELARSGRRRPSRAASPYAAPLMAGIAIAIPIIVSLFVVTAYVQGRAAAEVEAYLVGAQNAATQAAQSSGAEARGHWQEAAAQADEVLARDPANLTAAAIITQSQAAIDQIDNVVRLQPVKLYDFQSIGQHRLAMQGFSLFVLDRGTSSIDRLTLNAAGDGIEGGGPETVFAAGTSIDGQLPGPLLDMAWMNSSNRRQTSSLIVLHQGGLFEYNLAFGLKALDFGTNPAPTGLKRLRTFIGNLYVLDPSVSQILKYEPQGDAYSSAPTNYFGQAQPDAARAVDMAIDGSVYLLTNDGVIRKFLGGEPAAFEVKGLPAPLQLPSILAVDVNGGDTALYVYDQGAGRIVQLRPDGQFVRQFRAAGDAFVGVEDLIVDEQNSRLFVVTHGGGLFTAALPPVQ